jgi:hypothetical protein
VKIKLAFIAAEHPPAWRSDTNAWVIGVYLKVIGEYQKSLEKYPNPKPVNLTEFGK